MHSVVFSSFVFGANEDTDFGVVMGKFDAYFIPKCNVIHKRACFVSRCNVPGREWRRALYKLSDHCDF